ncbi:MAG: bifunctional ADP-dependent NAD(P)H-hydrate dehydratase/NAD(P)H-hydrate epimerase [Hydrogenophilales bacterium 16-64-46]|nr:MAG: bifunctional ADP-dependent NAD(P)H-hydrate dehydratase/NAD(P)H-hydrate epimerase [Hydrogenophilales bacterium 12-64-13]OYZ06197.1 MAG: bifunctional ADP-dependent NAD(P)H-hydrate dehydratase/NAD(P)H-hydrate epimerase [Hydrogenophilales bacterium 16-64-46]OZA38904.1 MAG: bifunctional ADP-dependent NAD(P)H-hydrate dehydratase/NAD(P)H-hydrate epimerase [Hydrogenophilales bacterium 17-64-34]HQS99446.1 NAD(P)H-hydrate dehydratase [Thiobacillus sp.]
MPTPLADLISPPLYPAAAIRAMEQTWRAAHPDDALMEKAGAAAAEYAATLAHDTGAPVLVLAGPGNNGGDAFVAARRLAARGLRVVVASRADPARLPPDAAHARAAWIAAGGRCLSAFPASQNFCLLIDGLFGAGLAREVTGIDAQWIAQANALACPRLALDVPSGLDADTGQIRGIAMRADVTLTFLGAKPGLLTADGPDYAGAVFVDTLGVVASDAPGFALTRLEPRHHLPPRPRNSHKGLFGHAGVVGGAPGMVGAALIAGRAALAHGAGLVTLGVLDTRVAVDTGEPRLMFATPESLVGQALTMLAIGPGLGQTATARALLAVALATPCTLVLDADALNLLAGDAALAEVAAQRTGPTLLTPHPGEAARLLGCDTAAVQADRIAAATVLSTRFGAHVALKGAGTVIAHPRGRYAINTTGGPNLAQAGSGDRLTGIAAALLAQGMAAGDALEAAVWRHGCEP